MWDAISKALADVRALLLVLAAGFALLAIVGSFQTGKLSLNLDPKQRGWLAAGATVFAILFVIVIAGEGRPSTETSGASVAETLTHGTVVDAPNFAYRLGTTALDREGCLAKAKEVMARGGLTGIAANDRVAFGYKGPYLVAVACQPETQQQILFTAGKDLRRVRDLQELLVRSY